MWRRAPFGRYDICYREYVVSVEGCIVDTCTLEAWEYYTWLGSKWDEKFFPAIDIAIALNEVNHK